MPTATIDDKVAENNFNLSPFCLVSPPSTTEYCGLITDYSNRKARILSVEDDFINRRLIRRLLEKRSLTPAQAENGLIGYDFYVQAHQQGHPYDIVLMDVQMPVLNGTEASKQIRRYELENELRPVPIYMITSNHDDDEVKDLCFHNIVNGIIPKPFDAEDIYRIVCPKELAKHYKVA